MELDLWDFMMPWQLMGMLSSGLGGLVSLAGYVWISLCLYIIAQKTKTENPWLAWIPIANIVIACQIAGKPWWWVFLFLIPIANFVFLVLVVWRICEVRNKPGWLSILMLVPVANLIIPGILAFVDS